MSKFDKQSVNGIDRFFGITKAGSTMKTEIIAGITTFLAMAYIIAVNPGIISSALPKANQEFYFNVIFIATCIAAAIGTFMMSIYAKLPIALAPGMGINAFFAFYTIGDPKFGGLGFSFQEALAAVFLSGIIFILISVTGVREQIVKAVPANLRHAITAGIGLFIALIGLKDAGIVVGSPATLVTMINFKTATAPQIASALLAFAGVLLIGVLIIRKVKGAILIGIATVTIAGIPFHVTDLSKLQNAHWLPQFYSWNEYTTRILPDFKALFTSGGGNGGFATVILSVVMVIITLTLVELFDGIGTLIGTGAKAGLLDKEGRLPNMEKALLSDAVATTIGAFLGTSSVTAYIESGAGIAEGGRTGFSTTITGILFVAALFLSPLFLIIPYAATAPALIIVGVMMLGAAREIDFSTMDEAIPAFFTIVMMPFAFSISAGISFGFIAYPVVKIAAGKHKEVHPIIYVLAGLFILRYALIAG